MSRPALSAALLVELQEIARSDDDGQLALELLHALADTGESPKRTSTICFGILQRMIARLKAAMDVFNHEINPSPQLTSELSKVWAHYAEVCGRVANELHARANTAKVSIEPKRAVHGVA